MCLQKKAIDTKEDKAVGKGQVTSDVNADFVDEDKEDDKDDTKEDDKEDAKENVFLTISWSHVLDLHISKSGMRKSWISCL
jgi:hypothetical protein